jgi:molecular chaperone DnaK
MMQTEIHLPYLTADASGPKHLVMTMTRSKLEQLTADLVDGTLNPLRQALEDAGLKPADINEVVMVGGMTRMPAVQESVRRFFNKEPHKGVNPDEVVAIGAAIQAGVLGGEVKDILLLDVTPLTLSIETLGSVATPQIDRNTTIPTRKSQIFSTASDSQTQVEIHILQGERPMAIDNKSLGKFILDGIPPAPRGVPQVEVTFDIDANGILKVTAQDKASGRSQNITITASSGLAKDEVERMRKEAEAHAAEDKKRRDLIDARNTADNSIYGAEKILGELGEKIPGEIKAEVQAAVEEVKKVKEGDDEPSIRKAVDSLSQVVQKVGAAAYQEQAAPPAGGEAGPQQDGPNVVDGETKDA